MSLLLHSHNEQGFIFSESPFEIVGKSFFFVKVRQFLQTIRMLNLEKYRSSTDYREILRILQKASATQGNILWQSYAIGKNVIPIHHFEIDFVTREVVILYDGVKYQLDSHLPIYLKLDYRTSVFKVIDYRQNSNSVQFSFPAELKTQELRNQPRHQFPPHEERSVTVKPSMTSVSRDTGHELNVRILDISETGMGLIISEHNRAYLKNNRILWVTKVQDTVLQQPILAEVIYINNEIDPRYLKRKYKELKVGLKLSSPLPSHLLQKLIQ